MSDYKRTREGSGRQSPTRATSIFKYAKIKYTYHVYLLPRKGIYFTH